MILIRRGFCKVLHQPLLSYLIGGNVGAIAATVSIFLPSFIFVAIFSRFLEKLRRSPLVAGFLDGVNSDSLGLMVVVILQLGHTSIITEVGTALSRLRNVLVTLDFIFVSETLH